MTFIRVHGAPKDDCRQEEAMREGHLQGGMMTGGRHPGGLTIGGQNPGVLTIGSRHPGGEIGSHCQGGAVNTSHPLKVHPLRG